jgi:hypothetical protein
MRIILQFCVAMVISVCGIDRAHSQATFNFDNYRRVDAPIFDAAGNRLFGTNFLAALYGGPSPNSLEPAYVSLSSGHHPAQSAIAFLRDGQAGYFAGGKAYVGNVPGGADAWLQVRAWDTTLGATYEEVAALGQGGFGESNIFQERGGDDTLGVPKLPGNLLGLESFSLREVPEPGSAVLLLLGLQFVLRRLRHS